MRGKFIIIMLFFFQCVLKAHPVFRSDSLYKSIDSCYVFVSTRSVHFRGDTQFLGNTIAPDEKLRFYNVYFNGAKLKIAPRRSLEEALNNTNISKDFVLYTEGNGKTFSDNIARGIDASRLYGINVILFDWPSRVPEYSLQKNFYVSLHNSKSVSNQFHELLLQLNNYKKQVGESRMKHVSLFFHSLGNYVWLTTLKKYDEVQDLCLIDNIIFNAPCIPSHGHEKWLKKLSCQKNIYVIYNSNDRLLEGAAFMLGRFILGRNPMRFAKNALYFDLNPAANISHNCFLRRSVLDKHPEIHTLYNNLFHAIPLDLNDPHIADISGLSNNFLVF